MWPRCATRCRRLLGVHPDDSSVGAWNNIAFGFFLLGGAVGGVFFGVVSDRIGRSKTMILTILFYSMFTCLSAFSQEAWHMVVLRFLVAMGVGGEWAVASAMVAEVMPTRSRATMGSIFHASSVFGTLLAAATVAMLIGNQALNDRLAAAGWEGWRHRICNRCPARATDTLDSMETARTGIVAARRKSEPRKIRVTKTGTHFRPVLE